MIARVTLEIALRKEFDYAVPPELLRQVDVGTRVQVPFGGRKVFGIVTALAEESAYAQLRPIVKIVGTPSLVTPKVLALARWIADYYCCAPEIALKSVLPEAVRAEDAGWRGDAVEAEDHAGALWTAIDEIGESRVCHCARPHLLHLKWWTWQHNDSGVCDLDNGARSSANRRQQMCVLREHRLLANRGGPHLGRHDTCGCQARGRSSDTRMGFLVQHE